MKERLRPRPQAHALRCAYCHGEFAPAESDTPCPECGTLLHTACRLNLDRCPTLGCAGRSSAPPQAARWRRELAWASAGYALYFVSARAFLGWLFG